MNPHHRFFRSTQRMTRSRFSAATRGASPPTRRPTAQRRGRCAARLTAAIVVGWLLSHAGLLSAETLIDAMGPEAAALVERLDAPIPAEPAVVDPEETSRTVALPAPPELPTMTVEPVPSPAEARGDALRGTLPPPAPGPCFTVQEYEAAMLGSGCDCSCAGYARQPGQTPAESRRCDAVCGIAWYACWAPEPSEADIQAHAADMGPFGPMMLAEPDGRALMIGTILLSRATEWHDARMCR